MLLIQVQEFGTGTRYGIDILRKYGKKVETVCQGSLGSNLCVCTLEFRIDGTRRLLIIPFFATLPNLIHHSPFINFGEFCQPVLLFQTPRLLIDTHSQQR